MSATPKAIAAVKWFKHGREWRPYAARRFVERNAIPVHLLASVVKFEARRKSNPRSKQ